MGRPFGGFPSGHPCRNILEQIAGHFLGTGLGRVWSLVLSDSCPRFVLLWPCELCIYAEQKQGPQACLGREHFGPASGRLLHLGSVADKTRNERPATGEENSARSRGWYCDLHAVFSRDRYVHESSDTETPSPARRVGLDKVNPLERRGTASAIAGKGRRSKMRPVITAERRS